MFSIETAKTFSQQILQVLGGWNLSRMINKKFVLPLDFPEDLPIKYELLERKDISNWTFVKKFSEINQPNQFRDVITYVQGLLEQVNIQENFVLSCLFKNHNMFENTDILRNDFENIPFYDYDFENTIAICNFDEPIVNKCSEKYYLNAINLLMKNNPNKKFTIVNFTENIKDQNELEMCLFLSQFRNIVIDNSCKSFLPSLGLWNVQKFEKNVIRPENIYINCENAKMFKLSSKNNLLSERINSNYRICLLTVSRRVNLLKWQWEQIIKHDLYPMYMCWIVIIDANHVENKQDINDFVEFSKDKNIVVQCINANALSDLRNIGHQVVMQLQQKYNEKELIVCIQDDDDFYTKDSTVYRIQPIIDGLTDITGQEGSYHLDIVNEKMYKFRNINTYSGTNAFLSYTSSYIRKHLYESGKKFGEELSFLDGFTPRNNMYQIYNVFSIAIAHNHNTCQRKPVFELNLKNGGIIELKYDFYKRFITPEQYEYIKNNILENRETRDYEQIPIPKELIDPQKKN